MNASNKHVVSGPTITAKQAIAQGSSPGFLLTVANSLERLGREYNSASYEKTWPDGEVVVDHAERKQMRAQADENFRQAAQLRRVARDVRKLWATVPGVCRQLVETK